VHPLNLKTLQHSELQSKNTGEKFSFSLIMSDCFGFKDVFIHHDILLPGRRSSSPHAHSHREELIYVVKGCPTAIFKDEKYRLTEGDFFGFPPGEDNCHYVVNESSEQVELLVVASNPPEDTVIYPKGTK
jgi:uncharacterized cupin superfamily protein